MQPALRRGATAALGAPALHPVGAAPRAGRDEPDVLLRLLPGEKSAKALDPDVAAPSQGFEHAGKDGVAVLVMMTVGLPVGQIGRASCRKEWKSRGWAE